jgi:hypothetical protein
MKNGKGIHVKTVEKWRFSELDYSSAQNNFGGLYNALNFPNMDAFAVLPHGAIEPLALRVAKAY